MASININIDDILWEMGNWEKQELVDGLYDDGYVPKQVSETPTTLKSGEMNVLELEWAELVQKLKSIRLRITQEDEEIITNILKKY